MLYMLLGLLRITRSSRRSSSSSDAHPDLGCVTSDPSSEAPEVVHSPPKGRRCQTRAQAHNKLIRWHPVLPRLNDARHPQTTPDPLHRAGACAAWHRWRFWQHETSCLHSQSNRHEGRGRRSAKGPRTRMRTLHAHPARSRRLGLRELRRSGPPAWARHGGWPRRARTQKDLRWDTGVWPLWMCGGYEGGLSGKMSTAVHV